MKDTFKDELSVDCSEVGPVCHFVLTLLDRAASIPTRITSVHGKNRSTSLVENAATLALPFKTKIEMG